MNEPEFDLESVYDEKIAPLMSQIIAICKENKMPMLASFCYRNNGDRTDLCTTALLRDDWRPKSLATATLTIYDPRMQ